jgi:tetratricopeptide (TPR) repeat protein
MLIKPTFAKEPSFSHGQTPRTAVLLCNLGTPDAPTAPAVRRYLAEFLGDPRVVEIPRWIWMAILHGIILRLRPAKSAAKYATIWTPEGSPLKVHTVQQAQALQTAFDAAGQAVTVRYAMSYANPSIASQLDALKASTSKLISNDAIDLSLLITDNFNMDTIPLPMMQYARAELLAYQNQFDLCFQTLDSITTEFPGHSLTDEILFTKANIYRKQGDFEKALLLYTELVNIHFEGIYADDALFAMAEIEEKHNKDLAKAQTHYERLLNDFPGSLFVIDARKRYRALKGEVQ